jgi:hypothetical protein
LGGTAPLGSAVAVKLPFSERPPGGTMTVISPPAIARLSPVACRLNVSGCDDQSEPEHAATATAATMPSTFETSQRREDLMVTSMENENV